MTDVQTLLNDYHTWLKDKTVWTEINEWAEITTPYLDRHNDYIQIYLKKEGDDYILTDDSYTIQDLEQEGCHLDTGKRKSLLTLTLNGFGVEKNSDDALMVKATPESFSLKKHNLIQAVLAVNDLFYLASPHITSLFFEDVRDWLDQEEIRYSERVSFMGHSGYSHLFDFLIPKSRTMPERIIKLINRPEKTTADSLVMSWLDTKDERPEGSRAYAFVNDNDKNVPAEVSDALSSYEIKPILWSKRAEIKEELAA
jgi:hypothetical protein